MPWPAGVPRGRRCGPGTLGGLARCSSQTAAPACNSHPVTSTQPPGGHDRRTVGPPSCLSRPPPSVLAGRGRCTSFATARSPTPPRLAPTPPPSWPTPGTLRSPPWPAALVSHQQPWPAGRLDATPPPGGLELPSAPTQRFGVWGIATVLDMRFADGTVVRVRQPSAWTRCRSRRACPFSRRELLERATAARAPAEVDLCPETGPDRFCHEQAEEQQGAPSVRQTATLGQFR